jgi:hypothetical protein
MQDIWYTNHISDELSHQENSIFPGAPSERRQRSTCGTKRKRGQDGGLSGDEVPHYDEAKLPYGELMMRQAAAVQKCAFKTGFAAEGMLCNEPPIPLRVLDFLGTYELVNLSLVCKATHQAGHVLLEREVRGFDSQRVHQMSDVLVQDYFSLQVTSKSYRLSPASRLFTAVSMHAIGNASIASHSFVPKLCVSTLFKYATDKGSSFNVFKQTRYI